jgi:anti-sigma B factor antagonist
MAHPFYLLYERGRLYVGGELDIMVSDQLEKCLATLDGQPVVLDLSGLTFIDSSGIRALLTARAHHPALRLDNVPPFARRLFVIAGVTRLLYSSEDAPARHT